MSLSDIARALGLALQQSSGRTPAAGHPVGSSGSSGTPFSSASYAQLHMMRAYGQGAGQVGLLDSASVLLSMTVLVQQSTMSSPTSSTPHRHARYTWHSNLPPLSCRHKAGMKLAAQARGRLHSRMSCCAASSAGRGTSYFGSSTLSCHIRSIPVCCLVMPCHVQILYRVTGAVRYRCCFCACCVSD
jgi:hypothetical protein